MGVYTNVYIHTFVTYVNFSICYTYFLYALFNGGFSSYMLHTLFNASYTCVKESRANVLSTGSINWTCNNE